VERAIAIDKTAVPEVKKAVESGDISLREGERIAKLPAEKQRIELVEPTKPDNYDLESLKRVWVRVSEDTKKEFIDWMSSIYSGTPEETMNALVWMLDMLCAVPPGATGVPVEDRSALIGAASRTIKWLNDFKDELHRLAEAQPRAAA
jgi:hypothetical protein